MSFRGLPQAWHTDSGDSAIWEEAGEFGVDTVGHLMLDRAEIIKGLRSDDPIADDLTEEEIAALIVIGEEFENGGGLRLVCLTTGDDTQVCRAACETVSG